MAILYTQWNFYCNNTTAERTTPSKEGILFRYFHLKDGERPSRTISLYIKLHMDLRGQVLNIPKNIMKICNKLNKPAILLSYIPPKKLITQHWSTDRG